MLKIIEVDRGSAGECAGLLAGDAVVYFNGREAVDILDYAFVESEDNLKITVRRGEREITFAIKKHCGETLGLNFEESAYLNPMQCRNKCVFCFVDQLPKGMRETLYIKDDDYRLSFVSGNFVTLTNLSDSDVKRIIDMKLSPLYVSVHSLDEDIRRKLLGVKNCRPLFPLLKLFCDNGIIVHTQIVLCPGINDADLLNTLAGLAALYPGVESAAVVPVGLTAHRSGLPVLKPVGLEAATAAVAAVEKINSELNAGFAFCADEIYLEADLPFPDYESYGDFVQIENGVGLMTKFAVEFDEALIYAKKVRKKSFTVITGKSAEDFMLGIIGLAKEMFPDLDVEILAVANSFFGESVTVAGLVTGGDILKELPEGCSDLIIPAVMLRELENVFLDGMTLEELSAAAKRKVTVCPVDGYEFAKKLLII